MVRGTLSTKADATENPSHMLHFAASPLHSVSDQARYPMNGTAIQSVAGGLDTHAQLQLRLALMSWGVNKFELGLARRRAATQVVQLWRRP